MHTIEVYLAVREELKLNKILNIYQNAPVASKFAYIPILDNLSFILSTPGVVEKLRFEFKKNDTVMKDIFDGSVFSKNKLNEVSQYNIYIHLYFEEFEVVNPLVSKPKGHKIGAIYFIIRNLPSYINSQLSNIHVIALFCTVDVPESSFNEVLEPIIKDIKYLETNGITIGNQTFKGTIIALSFDNLGGNTMLGLVESFSALYFLRTCTVGKADSKVMTVENSLLLRNRENYIELMEQGIPPKLTHNKGVEGSQYSTICSI